MDDNAHTGRKGRDSPMTETRVRELIDAYGASPARWPQAEREAAGDLLARSPALRDYATPAAGLDALLDNTSVPAPPATLRQSVLGLANAPATPARRALRWRLPRFVLPIFADFRPAALALATVLGLAFGYSGLIGDRGGSQGWESLDASLIAGGSQLVGVSYYLEENR